MTVQIFAKVDLLRQILLRCAKATTEACGYMSMGYYGVPSFDPQEVFLVHVHTGKSSWTSGGHLISFLQQRSAFVTSFILECLGENKV